MDKDQNSAKRGRIGPVGCSIIAALILIPLLYVLSTGPMTWLHHQGIAAWDGVAPFYAPLDWLGDAIPPLGEALRQYKRLWETKAASLPRTSSMSGDGAPFILSRADRTTP